MNAIPRRRALWLMAGVPLAFTSLPTIGASKSKPVRMFFLSHGKTGIANADGSEVRYLELDAPNQVTWQAGGCFKDGRRVVMLSMEPRRDGPGRPFEEYYTQTPTHLWQYDLETGSLLELCTKNRIAPFITPALLISDERILIQVVKNKVGQIYSVHLDGSDAREFTKAGEGLPYGLSLSPDGNRVAYHLASPHGYQIWTSDTEGGNRIKVAAGIDHLYFGPQWSPDGKWVLYVDCLHGSDPGHDWADVCIGRADGSEHRVLTNEQSMWFAATYGDPKTRGGGSNVPVWTNDGWILFPRRSKDAKVPWEYRVNQPDMDHFNREYQPGHARGGTQICKLDPNSREIFEITPSVEGVWDFRASQATDGTIVFCRAKTSEAPAIWVTDKDGKSTKMITRGIDDLGADHPRWIPS